MERKFKVCGRCKEELPIDNFRDNGTRINGSIIRDVYCKPCRKKYYREWLVKKNKGKKISYHRRYRRENKEKILDYEATRVLKEIEKEEAGYAV